ncbi:MAG: DUF1501 domain-containing protein [Planctomycetota bacterium]
MQRLVPVLGLIALVQTIAVPPPPGAPRRASDAGDDAERARALLAARCFACHGPDERAREAELRLDTRDGLRGVVVPGDAAASELVARVSAAVDRMPPDEAGDALDADEVALLVRWIDAGAELREHWSFRPLERPDVPTVSDPGWCRTPLDAFVLAELDAHGLRPSPVADRATLLTRVSLDLTGLPPSPERVRAFLADPSDDAYERVVDELLAEPAYGERWASVWLDLARYADSAGYGSDPLRTIWPWRDWLVGALNEDVPFDRFTELVLAGDLVEGADDLTRLATAFHRNTLTNTEGGTDDEEFRIAAVKDRVDTTMQVWMGLTAGCARCHDHKFDPISQREYYDLVDLFNQTADADLDDEAPKLATPSRAEREVYDTALREVRDAEAALQRRHDALVPPLDHAFLMAPDVPLVPESVAFASGGGVSTGTGDDAATIVALSPAAADTLRVRVRWPEDVGRGAESVGLPGISFGLRASASPDLPNGGPGLSPGNGNFVVNELHVRAVEPGPLAAPVRYVTIQLHGERRILSLAEVEVFSGDVDVARGSRASQSSTDFGGAAERAIDGTTSGKYEDGSVTHTRNERDPWFELELREPAVVDRVVVHNRTDGELGRRLAGATIAFFDASGRLLRRSVLAGAERDRAELVVARDHELFLQAPWATVEQEGWPATAAVDGDTATGWGVAPGVGRDQVLRVLTDDLRCLGDEIDVEVVQTFGDLHVAGRVELFANGAFTELGVAAPQFADLQERVDPRPFTAPLAEDHPVRLVRAYRRASEALAAIPATETPVLEELPSYRRRDTFVHVRGDFRSPGEPAHAGVPDAFLFGDEPTDRLELAHWLTDERNPLTARVAANRLFARLRHRPRHDGGGLRDDGGGADEPGAARPPGLRVPRRRLEHEALPARTRDERDLPPGVARRRREPRARSRRDAALAHAARASRGGDGARSSVGGVGAARPHAGRAAGVPAPARGTVARRVQRSARLADEHGRRSAPPRPLHLPAPHDPVPHAHRVRRDESRDVHAAPRPHEHAAAGADAARRPRLRGVRAGAGARRARRGTGRRPRASRRAARARARSKRHAVGARRPRDAAPRRARRLRGAPRRRAPVRDRPARSVARGGGRRRARGDDPRGERRAQPRRVRDQAVMGRIDLGRRALLRAGGLGFGALALHALERSAAAPLVPRARSVIYLHMSGAPPQQDLLDRKPELERRDGETCPIGLLHGRRLAFTKGHPTLLAPRQPYVRAAGTGQWISSLLPRFAEVADRTCMVHSVTTDQINHAPAELLLFTGTPVFGGASMGSWVTYGLGTENDELPGYVVMTSGPSDPTGGKSLWGSGFLPAHLQGVRLRSRGEPILHLADPAGLDRELRRASLDAVGELNRIAAERERDPAIIARIAQYELAFRIQRSVPEAVDLRSESAETLELYGAAPGESSFANHCLVARRLVERGVRFVHLFDWGWDVHGTGPGDDLVSALPAKCAEVDRPIAALLRDLERRGLLEETLVVWGGEFGRTATNEARDGSTFLGRDHQAECFTVWLAGAGVRAGHRHGESDEFGSRVASDPVDVRDLQATILHLLGLDPHRLTYPYRGLEQRLIGPDDAPRVVRDVLA